jgi:hypothetical protein
MIRNTPSLTSKPTGWAVAAILLLGMQLAACDVPQAIVERAPVGQILFQDDFADTNSGWDQVTAESGETNYSEGTYRIWVNELYTDLWANPDLEFTDTRTEVEAKKFGGPDDNIFGLICRSNKAGDQYYYFVISSDGYYGIGKVNGQEQTLLSADQLMPSDAINPGRDTNLLQAECIGDRLAFNVNGQKLAEVQDRDYLSGDIGLTAGTFTKEGVDIRFDNLMVIKP